MQYTHDEWLRTPSGPHAVTIEVNDGKGGTAVRTIRFTKNENKIIIQKKTPFSCDARPEKILLTPTWQKEGAKVKVETCNNAFDVTPTWEDATERVLLNKVYRFTNETKTAENWGINYRITLIKNEGYEGEINISSIGGAFE